MATLWRIGRHFPKPQGWQMLSACDFISVKRLMALIVLVTVALTVQAQDAENTNDLVGQVESLQSQMGFRLSGLEKIGNEPKVNVRGSLEEQLRQVLASYNYVINRKPKGGVAQVVIINKKQKTETSSIVLPTRYQDGHFLVSVDISGDGALWQTLDMIIDTGADLMVLPESMIVDLGLADYVFTARKMQTANGVVNAKIGVLKEVRFAGEILENVEVAFMGDRLLANNRLLGMSALGRYKFTIDDQSQLVTLFKN